MGPQPHTYGPGKGVALQFLRPLRARATGLSPLPPLRARPTVYAPALQVLPPTPAGGVLCGSSNPYGPALQPPAAMFTGPPYSHSLRR
eukprot:gene7650-biopygen4571